jgi:circadian clock protein KaiC
MVTRLIDYLKAGQVTSLFTSLTPGGQAPQQSEAIMSSLMDAWLLLQDFEGNGERNRVLYVLKARGMAHSNQSARVSDFEPRHRRCGRLHRRRAAC